MGVRLWELIREICRTNDIEILQGNIRPDHVHPLLSIPPDPRAEPRNARDQRQDVESVDTGLSNTAAVVLRPTSVGSRRFRGD